MFSLQKTISRSCLKTAPRINRLSPNILAVELGRSFSADDRRFCSFVPSEPSISTRTEENIKYFLPENVADVIKRETPPPIFHLREVGLLEPVLMVTEVPKIAKKPRTRVSEGGRKVYSVSPDSKAENEILDFYRGDLSRYNDTIFCLFNPGFSKLPEKMVEANARRLLIFDSNKQSCDHWRRFKNRLNLGTTEFSIEQLDFTLFPNQNLSDLRKEKPNTFVEMLKKYDLSMNKLSNLEKWPTQNSGPSVSFIGALPFFKERSILLELLKNRIQCKHLFEFGPVDFMFYVSASKYMVLDSRCPVLHGQCRTRRHAYSLFFDTNLISQVPLSQFSPQISGQKKVTYKSVLEKGGINIENAFLMHIRPKLDNEIRLKKPQNAPPQDSASSLYVHFDYFNHQLFSSSKTVMDFTQNLFPGSENCLVASKTCSKLLKRKAKSLNLDEEIELFNTLNSWNGCEDSVFRVEAEKYVETMCYPNCW